MGDKNWTINVSDGGQINIANDNATVYAVQNNGINASELDKIIEGIMDNLSHLEKEDASRIQNVINMAKEELCKSEPKVNKLRNCLSLITQMFAVTNGVPAVTDNLHKLVDYINAHIH